MKNLINNTKYIVLSVLALATFACSSGGDGGGTPDPKEENVAPNAVSSLTFPTNNLLCTSDNLEFSWAAATDPDSGDQISYILEISKDAQFGTIDITENASDTFKSVTLEKGVIYYWRVKAKDNGGLESGYSPVFQFYTEDEAVVNHLPFPAQATSPANNTTLSNSSATTTLEWSASDVDNDPLTYDVYFDTVNPPATKVGDNITDTSINVNISAGTTYYWKVDVKDNNSGHSIGQVWTFSTN
ncbi:hypothetical protein MHTCC0001_03680 [Flavobacteriaceae bacterium MHTCC 0001]